jgi:TRAP-type C4-dicarboxylate transport system substrate-binding protein
MAEVAHSDTEQVRREEKKIVEDTEKAGGTVHEFNPDASPQQKAAATRKVC